VKAAPSKTGFPARRLAFAAVIASCWFLLSACIYDVPITDAPTRKIDERLLGTWADKDGDTVKVVRLDDSNYIVGNHDKGSDKVDIYRAYHSDVDGLALVTVKVLDSDKPAYSYWDWKIADDGALVLRMVSDQIVPDKTPDSAAVRKLLEQNLKNPDLLGKEARFTKVKDQ
jgi:hypothetical protein